MDSVSLFALEKDKKESYFPKNWPLGHEADEEDGDGDGDRDVHSESFCLDSSCSIESTELNLNSLREFTLAMEKVGKKMVEMLASAVGFENPIREDPTQICSLMWVSQELHDMDRDKPVLSGGFYPYIVALQYQIRQQKYLLSTDSCRVTVSPQVDSILVTLGDMAQVSSNFDLYILYLICNYYFVFLLYRFCILLWLLQCDYKFILLINITLIIILIIKIIKI